MAAPLLSAISVGLNREQRRDVVLHVLQIVCAWLLGTFTLLQDWLLGMERFRSLLLRAFQRRYEAVIAGALRTPPDAAGFGGLEYHVDAAARETLQFAGLHALAVQLTAGDALGPSQLLPCVSRVLLTTEEGKSTRYLEAVAGALASGMHASLLPVDAALLARLAAVPFSGGPGPSHSPDSAQEDEGPLAGISLSGDSGSGRGGAAGQVLAWEALRRGVCAREAPTVVFLREADRLLCSTIDAYEAFQEAWGSPEIMALEGGSKAALVLVAGCTLVETGAGLAEGRPKSGEGASGRGGAEEGEDDVLPKPAGSSFFKGLFGGDDTGLFDDSGLGALLKELEAPLMEAKPSPRRVLPRLFPTRVKLQPAPSGPAALRHQQRVARDAREAAEEENFRAARATALSVGVTLPPRESGVFACATALTKGEWGRALAWAVTMQVVQRQQQAKQAQQAAWQEAEAEVAGGGASAREGHGAVASSSSDSSGGCGNSLQLAAEAAWKAALALTPLPLLAALCLRLLACTPPALQHLLGPLEGVLRWLAGVAAQQAPQQGPQQGAAAWQLVAACTSSAALDGPSASASSAAGLDSGEAGYRAEAGAVGPDLLGAGRDMQLSPQAVRYGLGMLKRSGGSVKQSVRASNSYEKRLLSEVLSPEDCGSGFGEVGALEEAKQALREVVQLPLQHPHLFCGGALARPSKGVLLFGPPGTGKTLLARAAAAECGASFLGINPSSVASKWFGDGVKYIRAMFSLAGKLSPCVIFVDEVDSLLGRRNSSKEHEALREMKNELMAQWDGIRPGQGSRVMVLGATNRPFDLDDAVLRRFTHRVFVGLPHKSARMDILGVILTGEAIDPDVDLGRVAEMTEGYSGSDLRQLCIQAAMRPVRELLEAEGKGGAAAAGHRYRRATKDAKRERGSSACCSGGSFAGAEGVPGFEAPKCGHGGEEEGQAPAAAGETGAHAAPEGLCVSAGLEEPEGGQLTGLGERAAEPMGALAPFEPQQLGSLLAAAESVASEAGRVGNELRPVSMQDFEEASKEVTPTVDPDSQTIQELNEWNQRYGMVGGKRGFDKRLSYYL